MRSMLRGLALSLAIGTVAALIVGGVVSAYGQEAPALSVSIDTVTRGEPNSTHLLATREARDDQGNSLAGQTCDVVVEGDNNGSVHPGNDLIVATTIDGEPSDLVVLPDFERAAGAVTEGRSRLTVGETLSLLVRLGEDVRPDGLVTSSGGAVVSLVDCVAPEPPPTSPTTTAPPCTEDMPCWDCATMGNMICGTTPAPPPAPQIGTPVPATTLPHTGGSKTWALVVSGVLAFAAGSTAMRARSERSDRAMIRAAVGAVLFVGLAACSSASSKPTGDELDASTAAVVAQSVWDEQSAADRASMCEAVQLLGIDWAIDEMDVDMSPVVEDATRALFDQECL